jgi:hypothetical protein
VRSDPAKPEKTVQWTVLSDERRELKRAAGGVAVAMAPFLAALAIEAGIFLLRRHQNSLMGRAYPQP